MLSEAKKIHDRHISTIAIGIYRVSINELRHLASDNDSVIHVKTFDKLHSIVVPLTLTKVRSLVHCQSKYSI